MKKIFAFILLLALLISSFVGCGEEKVDLALGNVVILGDSFSTFEGYIPEGYRTWYTAAGYAGVNRVFDTWWHRLVTATHSELILNSSYSGSTVCNTGYDGEDYSDISFATRAAELVLSGFFGENKVDTLIIFGGLNDCWAQSPRGDFKYEGFTDSDLYCFYPALSFILSSLIKATPDTRVVFIIETQLDGAMKDGIREVCLHYGVETVTLFDVELYGSHPNGAGMKSISDQIIAALSASAQ